MKIAKKKFKFAEEVSKKTYSDSIGKSKVQDLNSAPTFIDIPKDEIYSNTFDLNKLEMRKLTFKEVKNYIIENHYSHTLDFAVRIAFGFYFENELVTAIVYSHARARTIEKWLHVSDNALIELSRVFSQSGLPKNTESYCLAKTFKFLKQYCPNFKYLLSYSDPNQGHVGYIYQATNWKYLGKQKRQSFDIYLDGKRVHPHQMNKQVGTSSKKLLKDKFGDRINFKSILPKHTYILCLGNHKERKEWYSKFIFLPYPKAYCQKED